VPDKQPADNAAVHTPSDSLVGMSLSNAATPVLDKQTAANAAVHTSPDSVASVRLSKAATPVPDKQTATNAAVHTPSDSLVSVSLSESAGRASQIPSAVTSPTDIDGTLHRSSSLASNPAPGRVSQAPSADASPADIVDEVLRRASSHTSNPLPSLDSDRVSSLVSNPASSLVSDRTSSLVSNRTLSLVSNLTPSHTSNPAPGLISNRVSSLASNRASSLASDQVSSPVSNAAPSPTVHDTIDSPGAEARLAQDVAHEMARSKSASLTASKTSSVRARSDSTGSDSSILVDWDTLDKSEQTEHTQDVDSDEVSIPKPFNFHGTNWSSKPPYSSRGWSKKTTPSPPIPSPATRPAAGRSLGRRRFSNCTSWSRSRAPAPSAFRCCPQPHI
jgi:hypothetical protein